MKKKVITGIDIIICVALCAIMWPRSAEVEDLSAELVKTAVTAKIESRSEETPKILISVDTGASETENSRTMAKADSLICCLPHQITHGSAHIMSL